MAPEMPWPPIITKASKKAGGPRLIKKMYAFIAVNQEEPTEPLTESRDIPREEPSPKSYGVAVCLSGIFGYIGIQHFYLGRWFEGALDVGLTIGWISGLAYGEDVGFCLFLAADILHSLVVTIMLLTGSFRDGDGLLVAYPGQKLPPRTP